MADGDLLGIAVAEAGGAVLVGPVVPVLVADAAAEVAVTTVTATRGVLLGVEVMLGVNVIVGVRVSVALGVSVGRAVPATALIPRVSGNALTSCRNESAPRLPNP